MEDYDMVAMEDVKYTLLEHLNTAIAIADEQGLVVYGNKYCLKMLQYNKRELTSLTWRQICSYEPDNCSAAEVKSALFTTGNWEGNVSIVRKDGSRFPARAHLTVLPSSHVSCVFSDMSEQIKRETQLADLTAAVAAAMDGIALLGPDGTYYYLNEKHVTYFGYEHESELLGKTWRIFYPEHEIKRIEEDLFPQMARDGKWQGETLGRKKDGTPINQEITLTALPNGGMICIMRNITEKKQRESEIKKLALVASKTNNAVVITDANLLIEWMNESAEIIFETRDANTRPTKISGIIESMQMQDGVVTAIKTELEKGKAANFELKLAQSSGRKLWLHVEVNPVYENGLVSNYVFMFLDITTIKEAEANLSNALEKEKSLNQLKTHFVSLTSHEFRTPLTSIQSSLDILHLYLKTKGSVDNDNLTRHLNQIHDEVNRMTELMDNVLVTGKINSGKIAFKPGWHNLEQLLSEIVTSSRINQYGKEIKLNISGAVRSVYCDKRLLEHILYNLLINALKYSERASEQPEMDVVFNNEELRVSITDYGIGIPAEDQKHLFESFYRAGNAQNIPGTGLGLPIVKQFVELHGGSVGFKSTPGQKTVFHFNIPYKDA